MKVLITGAAGRLGRVLVERLARRPLDRDQQLILVDQRMASFPLDAEVMLGDLASDALLERVAQRGPDVVFHLAALPGGAAAADPELSRLVNLDATLDLASAVAAGGRRPRFVYASSIAVFGAPGAAPVDDDTPARPASTYGAHKLMVETALADMARRGLLQAVALRLPGLVAAPRGAAGLKSAFMSDLFHALAACEPFRMPVGAEGRLWLLSFAAAAEALAGLAQADLAAAGGRVALNAPAVHAGVAELVAAVAAATRGDPRRVSYDPDPELQAQFAAYPPLSTPAAEALGLRHDGSLEALVRRSLATLADQGPAC